CPSESITGWSSSARTASALRADMLLPETPVVLRHGGGTVARVPAAHRPAPAATRADRFVDGPAGAAAFPRPSAAPSAARSPRADLPVRRPDRPDRRPPRPGPRAPAVSATRPPLLLLLPPS